MNGERGPFSLAAEDSTPNPRYRQTQYGLEPRGAFPPVQPLPVPPGELVLRLIAETTNHGTTPRRAIKWWTYILAKLGT